jgi:serine/threonine protein kinase
MSSKRQNQIETVFAAARERPPAERAAFLAEACAGDPDLRREVESLLAYDPNADALVEVPTLDLVARAIGSDGRKSLAGATIGIFKVHELIGKGGMGEVYRARDTKLNRDVAIKVLPESVVQDAERIARFKREAQVLASLNHPNIAAIHELKEVGASNYLVLELVEGETLAERLKRGPLPLDETLEIARQIAEALEVAHEKGIIHRDLKPANVKITPAGRVKVLDFGLAKFQDSSAPADPSNSPTLSAIHSDQGVILGTVRYMSPEQARGKPVDKRTDIWAFGCVLYEMLAGRAAYDGETLSDTLAAILERDPDWQRLPAKAPRKVRELLRRCLQRDAQQRLRDIGDARLELNDAIMSPQPADDSPRRTRRGAVWAWVVAGAMILIAVALLRRPETPAMQLALTIMPPSASGIVPLGSELSTPEISPDGTFLTYHDRLGTLQLRRLNAISPEPLRGASGLLNREVWSADSKSLVFADGLDLKRMRVPDGAPETIGRLPGPLLEASLSDNGTLLFRTFGGTRSNLFTMPPNGGEPRQIEVPGLKGGGFGNTRFIPPGDEFLTVFRPPKATENEVYLVGLRDGQPVDPVLLMKNVSGLRYTPAGGGHVLFRRNENLYAQRLNRRARRLEGDPELLERQVSQFFSVSRSGLVAWRPGGDQLAQVTIFDRQGKAVGTAGPPMGFVSVKLSPDEQRVLVAGPAQAWLFEPHQPGRLNVNQASLATLWSPDSSRILVPQESAVIERRVDGSDARELARAPGLVRLEDVSKDGKIALFTNGTFATALFGVHLGGTATERAPIPVLQTGELVWNARFSPDAKWIVYQVPSQNGGIYVQPFQRPGLREQITSAGEYPTWRGDGKEIIYLAGNRIWSVRVDTSEGEFRHGDPEALFSVGPSARVLDVSQLAVSSDGSRIYFPQAVEQPDSDVIHVRTGWVK